MRRIIRRLSKLAVDTVVGTAVGPSRRKVPNSIVPGVFPTVDGIPHPVGGSVPVFSRVLDNCQSTDLLQ